MPIAAHRGLSVLVGPVVFAGQRLNLGQLSTRRSEGGHVGIVRATGLSLDLSEPEGLPFIPVVRQAVVGSTVALATVSHLIQTRRPHSQISIHPVETSAWSILPPESKVIFAILL